MAYTLAAWAAVQAIGLAAGAFGWPQWVLQIAIVAALLGFPLALFFAWAVAVKSETGSALRPAQDDLAMLGTIAPAFLIAAVILAIIFWPRTKVLPRPTVAHAEAQLQSVAVLPFANLSKDPSMVYFGDGVADQLIGELSRMPSLRVAARTSSFSFRGRDVDVKTIGKMLNVRTILEGSVRADGNRVRIAAELVEAGTGFQIWSESYDRDLKNILTLEADLAKAITGALGKRVWAGHMPVHVAVHFAKPKAQPINPDAYKAYLKGQFFFVQRTRDGVDRAIALFALTTNLAPNFADGFAALGDARSVKALNFADSAEIEPGLFAVKKALAFDPTNPTALIARTRLSIAQWKWRMAADDIRRLQRLRVGTAAAWRTRAVFFDYMGLPDLARTAEEKAVQLDPLSIIDRYNLAANLMLGNRYEEAMKLTKGARALQPKNPELIALECQIALHLPSPPAGSRRPIAGSRTEPDRQNPTAACPFQAALVQKNLPFAHRIVDMIAASSPKNGLSATEIGTAYAMTGDIVAAMTWYNRAFELHAPQLLRVPYANPSLAKLFSNQRWQALRAKPAIHDWEEARREIAAEYQAGE